MIQPAIATKCIDGGGDHQRVEDLVEAEHVRPRVRPAQRVDDGAGRVQQAAGGEQQQRRERQPRRRASGSASSAIQPSAT